MREIAPATARRSAKVATMEPGIPARTTGYLLWQVVNRWQRRQKQILAPFGLTPVQFLLLAGLQFLVATGGRPVTQVALARHCRTDPMMTSQVLRVLEGQNLISRRSHDADGRAMVLAVTEQGESLVTRAGETLASRVAGSILIHAGLRELVTQSAADCERKVLELATSPGRLKEIRGRLQASRDTCALFDTPRFVRNLEAIYEHIFGEYCARR